MRNADLHFRRIGAVRKTQSLLVKDVGAHEIIAVGADEEEARQQHADDKTPPVPAALIVRRRRRPARQEPGNRQRDDEDQRVIIPQRVGQLHAEGDNVLDGLNRRLSQLCLRAGEDPRKEQKPEPHDAGISEYDLRPRCFWAGRQQPLALELSQSNHAEQQRREDDDHQAAKSTLLFDIDQRQGVPENLGGVGRLGRIVDEVICQRAQQEQRREAQHHDGDHPRSPAGRVSRLRALRATLCASVRAVRPLRRCWLRDGSSLH